MTREQAINYLKSSGMSDEQIVTVADGLTKGAISHLRTEIERKAHSGQWSEATMFGMLKAVAIIDKYAESEET